MPCRRLPCQHVRCPRCESTWTHTFPGDESRLAAGTAPLGVRQVFHQKCIDEWLRRCTDCPICKVQCSAMCAMCAVFIVSLLCLKDSPYVSDDLENCRQMWIEPCGIIDRWVDLGRLKVLLKTSKENHVAARNQVSMPIFLIHSHPNNFRSTPKSMSVLLVFLELRVALQVESCTKWFVSLRENCRSIGALRIGCRAVCGYDRKFSKSKSIYLFWYDRYDSDNLWYDPLREVLHGRLPVSCWVHVGPTFWPLEMLVGSMCTLHSRLFQCLPTNFHRFGAHLLPFQQV